MKKFALIVLATATALGASAQLNVVKDAERAMKAKKSGQDVVNMITPAFSNSETQNLAQTYFIPGKAYVQQYDDMLARRALGQLSGNDSIAMCDYLVEAYGYFTKALPLDSLPNEKGKVKPKYSKEIINSLSGHFNDYDQAAVIYYLAGQYPKAFKTWDVYANIGSNPNTVKEITKVNPAYVPDSILPNVYYNMGLAAWQTEDNQNALNAFVKAKNVGYNKKAVYDNIIALASIIGDEEAVLKYSKEAQPIYGHEDDMYIQQIANYYLQRKDFDNAFSTINQAIELNPNNAQYYDVLGVLYENHNESAKAKEAYAKAISIDPNNAKALFDYGHILAAEAYTLIDNAPTAQAEYNAVFDAKIRPVLIQAADALERAYTANPDNMDTLNYLESIYYNLNDEAKLQSVKQRKL